MTVTARERSGPPMPDRSVEPEDLRFVAQRLAGLADALAGPVPYSYVIGQVQAALGSLDAPSAPRKRREEPDACPTITTLRRSR